MGKKLYLLFFILFLTVEIYSQDGWFWQNPSTTGNPLNDVCFIDANNGWAVGEYGTIIRTTDGGDNWTVQLQGKTYALNGVYFTDANNGTVVGVGIFSPYFTGIILRTIDGGENWIMQSSGVSCILNGVYFTDENNGTVVGGGTSFGGGYGTILRTTDGGEHWITQLNDTTTIAFNGVCFTDVNTGTVVGRGNWNGALQRYESKILRTTDGGKSWINQNSGVTCQLHAICFADSNVGWAVGGDGYIDEKSVILKTTDGGESWNNQLNDTTLNGLYDICFADDKNGVAVGSFWKDTLNTGYLYITVLKTTDGGNNWISHTSGVQGRFCKLSFTDANVGTVVGSGDSYPIILRTTDGGKNWSNQVRGSTYSFEDVYFTNANHGVAVGYDWDNYNYWNSHSGLIVRTTDGGKSWIRQVSGTTLPLWAVCFSDENTGTAVGGDYNGTNWEGIILRTTDGGKNWVRQYSGTYPLYGVCFTDANNGTAVGASRKILRTTDGGKNWISQSEATTTTEYFIEVSFTDANIGTVVGEDGTILRTTDGGNHWLKQTSGTSVGLEGVCFIDTNTGTAVGWGTILKTTDGGNTWINKFSCEYNIYDVNFSDENNGTAIGNHVLRTTDGGNTWVTQSILANNEFHGVCFADALTGWIVGSNGTILHTTNGGITYVEKEQINETPKDYLLYQNYPNPFNPSTKIQYVLSNKQFVTLKVYDILGKEVTILVNEEKPAGHYQVEFNAASLPSGVYFYRIRAGLFNQVRKMLLIK